MFHNWLPIITLDCKLSLPLLFSFSHICHIWILSKPLSFRITLIFVVRFHPSHCLDYVGTCSVAKLPISCINLLDSSYSFTGKWLAFRIWIKNILSLTIFLQPFLLYTNVLPQLKLFPIKNNFNSIITLPQIFRRNSSKSIPSGLFFNLLIL